ncbi:KfrB domain-containing protein [Candidatus Burkholderia verschuerenii]|uniref:KfrB domain-containing protein n=1 Tax=Candidatus Burkholderia verschuerenii TaxID=242163 RepID=UPI00067D464A|nr:KfrB domain-containing protein [Candidatus Burkholderia verschuerenii]
MATTKPQPKAQTTERPEPKTRSGHITHVTVANGSRNLDGPMPGRGERVTLHSLPPRGVPSGAYRLDTASPAVIKGGESYVGAVVHKDDRHVFQSVGTKVVRHDLDRFDFNKVPALGETKRIDYLLGRARAHSLTRENEAER